MGLEGKNIYVAPLLQSVKDRHTHKKSPSFNSSIIISFIEITTKALKSNAVPFKATSTDFKIYFNIASVYDTFKQDLQHIILIQSVNFNMHFEDLSQITCWDQAAFNIEYKSSTLEYNESWSLSSRITNSLWGFDWGLD